MKTVRSAILEDQRHAQKILQTYINDADYLELGGTYGSASEAAIALPSAGIDLLFLDLHLPKMDGFAFLATLHQPPLVIVTTADEQQALDGYTHNVVDYLLKPFSFERFLQAVEKARAQLSTAREASVTAGGHQDLFVKSAGEIRRVPVEQIQYIRSDGDYVVLVTGDRKYYFARTLQSLLAELPQHLFARVHRSYIVNLRCISRIVGPDIYVGDTTVPIGRSYREQFLSRISSG